MGTEKETKQSPENWSMETDSEMTDKIALADTDVDTTIMYVNYGNKGK